VDWSIERKSGACNGHEKHVDVELHRLVKQGETRKRIRPVSVLKDWSSHFHSQKFANKLSVGRGGGNNALLPIKGGAGGGMRGCRCGMKACRCSGRIILSELPKKEIERDVPQTYAHRAQTDSAGERQKIQQENERRSKRRERVCCWLAKEVHLLFSSTALLSFASTLM